MTLIYEMGQREPLTFSEQRRALADVRQECKLDLEALLCSLEVGTAGEGQESAQQEQRKKSCPRGLETAFKQGPETP